MDIKKLEQEVDEEIHEEESEKAKDEMKMKRRKYYYTMNIFEQLWQEVRCLVGLHMYNQVPSMGITTCPACTRIWSGMKGKE